MSDWEYRKGLHEVGNGCWAYLQPDGSWGWSNAGLVADGGSSLLVDTLFDLRLTRGMLSEMRSASPCPIGTVVNTHANGDHCFGNQLVAGAEVVASRRCAEEMAELPPGRVEMMVRVTRLLTRLGAPGRALTRALGRAGLKTAASLGEAADFVQEIFGAFDFRGIKLRLPTRTFDGELELEIGEKRVRLIEVGPAHTLGDAIVHVPGDKVVFTGDILFAGAHPVIWVGPVSRWIAACDRILAMDVEVVVPGHGPITDSSGVRRMRDHLALLSDEVRRCYEAGLSADEAAQELLVRPEMSGLNESERLIVNVDTIYRELAGDGAHPDALAGFARMACFRRGVS